MKAAAALKSFRNIREDPTSYLKGINKPIIGYFDTYIPEEIIMAAGMHPARISPDDKQITAANSKVPGFACSVSRNFLDQLMRESIPHLKGVVFSRYCDSLRGVSDVWEENAAGGFYHFLRYPTVVRKDSIEFLSGEFRDFADHLSKRFDVIISEKLLIDKINVVNRKRFLLLKFYDMVKKGKLIINSADFISIVSLATIMDSLEYMEKLNLIIDGYESLSDSSLKDRTKLSVSSIMIESLPFFRLIDKANMRIVTDDLMYGSRAAKGIVEKSEKGPYYALSKRYLNKIPCSTKADSDLRISELIKDCKEADVKGVLFYLVTFCDSEEAEFSIIEKTLQENKIPVLLMEGGYRLDSEGQFMTRLQAFNEQIGDRL